MAVAELRDRVRNALERSPNAMILSLARKFEVPEEQVVRCLPEGWVVELDIERWEPLIRRLENLGELHVLVSNGAATLEAVGHFGGFSQWEEFFNVQTRTLDMHIRWPHLGAAFAVTKPSHLSGKKTLSIQFFDRDGHAAFKAFLNFGAAEPTAEARDQFTALCAEFGLNL